VNESQCSRLLALLRRGPRSHHEIHDLAGHMIVNSRVAELRTKGHDISCKRVGDLYVYSLLKEAGEPNEPDGALAVDDVVETSPVPQAVASEPASPVSLSGDAHHADTVSETASVVSSLPRDAAPDPIPGQLSILEMVA
jgi:uncharacterized protein YceH (UPF0502 family)